VGIMQGIRKRYLYCFGNFLGVRSRCSECRSCHFHYFHSLCCHFHGCYFLCCLYLCYRVFFLLVSIWIEFLDDLVPIRDCLRYEILIVQWIRSVSNRRFQERCWTILILPEMGGVSNLTPMATNMDNHGDEYDGADKLV
jgi:hypothetical protein